MYDEQQAAMTSNRQYITHTHTHTHTHTRNIYTCICVCACVCVCVYDEQQAARSMRDRLTRLNEDAHGRRTRLDERLNEENLIGVCVCV